MAGKHFDLLQIRTGLAGSARQAPRQAPTAIPNPAPMRTAPPRHHALGKARLLAFAVLVLALWSAAAFAARVVLKNGQTVEGLIVDEAPNQYIIMKTGGAEVNFRWERIKSVDRETTQAIEEQLGDQMANADRYDEALRYYRAAQKSNRSDTSIQDKIEKIKKRSESRDLAQFGDQIRSAQSAMDQGRFEEAERILKNLKDRAPLETVRERARTLIARAHYLRAQKAMNLVQYSVAEKELRAAIELDPEFAPAYVELGDLFNTRQIEKKHSLDAYLKGLELGKNQLEEAERTRILWSVARLSQDIGQNAQALDYYKRVHAANPRYNARLSESIVSVCRKLASENKAKQRQKSIEYLQEALVFQPGDNSVRYDLASLYLDQHDLPKAVEQLRNLLEREERYPNGHYLLGTCLMDQGQIIEARDHFRAEVQNNPSHYEALCQLGELSLRGGDVNAASEYFKSAAEKEPGLARALLGMAKVLRRQKDRVAARRYVESVLAFDPKNRAANVEMGSVLKEEKNYTESRKYFDQVIKNLKESESTLNSEEKQLLADAFNRRGEVFILLEQPRTARNDFEEALRFAPAMGQTYFNIGSSYVKEGGTDENVKRDNLKKAEINYIKARQLQPETPEFAQGLAILYHIHLGQAEKDPVKKKEFLRKAVRNYQDYLRQGGADIDNVKRSIEECGGVIESK